MQGFGRCERRQQSLHPANARNVGANAGAIWYLCEVMCQRTSWLREDD